MQIAGQDGAGPQLPFSASSVPLRSVVSTGDKTRPPTLFDSSKDNPLRERTAIRLLPMIRDNATQSGGEITRRRVPQLRRWKAPKNFRKHEENTGSVRGFSAGLRPGLINRKYRVYGG